MSKYRWLGFMVSTMTLAVLMLGFFQGSAEASSKVAPQATSNHAFKALLVARPDNPEKRAIPFVTCSGDGCDGDNPHTTGCDVGQYTVSGGVAYMSSFSIIGDPITIVLKVELMWSPTCETNWARVTQPNSGTITAWAIVERGDGLAYNADANLTGAGSTVTSGMVYAPSQTGQACGGGGGSFTMSEGTWAACTPAI